MTVPLEHGSRTTIHVYPDDDLHSSIEKCTEYTDLMVHGTHVLHRTLQISTHNTRIIGIDDISTTPQITFTNDWYAVDISADNVELHNLTITGEMGAMSNAPGTVISACTFLTKHVCINVFGVDATIINNDLQCIVNGNGVGRTGVSAQCNDRTIITGNTIRNVAKGVSLNDTAHRCCVISNTFVRCSYGIFRGHHELNPETLESVHATLNACNQFVDVAVAVHTCS